MRILLKFSEYVPSLLLLKQPVSGHTAFFVLAHSDPVPQKYSREEEIRFLPAEFAANHFLAQEETDCSATCWTH